MRKGILKLVIISLCISAFLGIIIILNGNFGELEWKVLGTSSTIFGFSIAGLCCSALYEKEKYKSFSIFGMITALMGCLWVILIIWNFIDDCSYSDWCTNVIHFEKTYNMLGTFIVLCISTAHLSLMLLIKNQASVVASAKKFTIIFSGILVALILSLIWEVINDSDNFIWRLMAVLGILVALGTIVAPILNKVYKNTDIPLEQSNQINNQQPQKNVQQAIPQQQNPISQVVETPSELMQHKMKPCGNCGNENTEGSKFCIFCNANLEMAVTSTQEQAKTD